MKRWTWLVPPLASLLWMVPVVVVVVEVCAVFTGFGVVIPRMSIVTTDFARVVRTHGINRSMDRLFAPFLQLRGNHICLFDGMHAFGAGLESFVAPPLVGDHFLDPFFGFGYG